MSSRNRIRHAVPGEVEEISRRASGRGRRDVVDRDLGRSGKIRRGGLSSSSCSHDVRRRSSRRRRRRLSDVPPRRNRLEMSSSGRIVRRNCQSSSSIRILRRSGSRTMSARDSSSCDRLTVRSYSRVVVEIVVDDNSVSSVRRSGSGD